MLPHDVYACGTFYFLTCLCCRSGPCCLSAPYLPHPTAKPPDQLKSLCSWSNRIKPGGNFIINCSEEAFSENSVAGVLCHYCLIPISSAFLQLKNIWGFVCCFSLAFAFFSDYLPVYMRIKHVTSHCLVCFLTHCDIMLLHSVIFLDYKI